MGTAVGWPLVLLQLFARSADVPKSACPTGTRLVSGTHIERVVHHVCTEVRFGTCVAFKPGAISMGGSEIPIRVCMDEYEAPNIRGERPFVMKSSEEGAAWCKARGKRLCTEYEWETACEGTEHTPFGTEWRSDETCNTQKPWRAFHAYTLMSGGRLAELETERLWQGDRSGARATCVSREGVHDLLGNAEEWVTASRRYPWPTVLMGGHWAKHWHRCRMVNWAHEPTFRFYEVGFRCCSDPR